MSDNKDDSGRAAENESAARFPRDAIFGVGIVAFCIATWLVTLTFKEAPAVIAQNVQPATFPRLVIVVIAVLAVVIIFKSFRTADKRPKPVPAMVFVSAAVMPGFVIAFYFLGILPAMVLLCFALPLIWGERRLYFVVPYAIVFPGLVYLLFAVVLKVYFEPSPLVFW